MNYYYMYITYTNYYIVISPLRSGDAASGGSESQINGVALSSYHVCVAG